jgi:hypothetical protein
VALAVGCAGASPEPIAPKPAPVAAAPEPLELLRDADWAAVVSTRLQLQIPLPDAGAWRVASTPDWFVASHDRSDSELRLTTFLADGVVNRSGCEALARKNRLHVPTVRLDEQVGEQILNRPSGFDTAVRLSVQPIPPRELGGIALAIGANVRRCLVMVFVTKTRGADAESRLAARLDLVTSGVFARVESRTVDARAMRQPLEPLH